VVWRLVVNYTKAVSPAYQLQIDFGRRIESSLSYGTLFGPESLLLRLLNILVIHLSKHCPATDIDSQQQLPAPELVGNRAKVLHIHHLPTDCSLDYSEQKKDWRKESAMHVSSLHAGVPALASS
jgi:hypothetical protein